MDPQHCSKQNNRYSAHFVCNQIQPAEPRVGQGRVRAEDGGDPLRSRGNARVLQDEEALQLLTQHQLAQVSRVVVVAV
jgi:hypothetical protein